MEGCDLLRTRARIRQAWWSCGRPPTWVFRVYHATEPGSPVPHRIIADMTPAYWQSPASASAVYGFLVKGIKNGTRLRRMHACLLQELPLDSLAINREITTSRNLWLFNCWFCIILRDVALSGMIDKSMWDPPMIVSISALRWNFVLKTSGHDR